MLKKELILNDLAKLLEMDVNELSDDFFLNQSGNWDSLTILSLVGAFNLHYKKTVFAKDIGKCQTVKDLLNLAPEKVS